jgi:hypothetical protein
VVTHASQHAPGPATSIRATAQSLSRLQPRSSGGGPAAAGASAGAGVSAVAGAVDRGVAAEPPLGAGGALWLQATHARTTKPPPIGAFDITEVYPEGVAESDTPAGTEGARWTHMTPRDLRIVLLLGLATLGCGTPAATPDGARGDASAHDAAVVVDATPDAPPPVTPWGAPTGAALTGVTLGDGWQDLRALSAPLEIPQGWTDSLYAMPNGRTLLFAYEQTDFFQFYHAGTTALTGPALAGVSPPTFKIFEADLGSADWQVSLHPINAADPNVVEASPAANATGDVLVFTVFETTGRAHLMWSKHRAGGWDPPAPAPFNSAACNDDNAKVVGDLATGLTFYFESTRGDLAGTGATCGARRIYAVSYALGVFGAVVPVPGIVPGDDDSQPSLSPDGQTLYWTSVRSTGYGVWAATRQADGSFGAPRMVAEPTTFGTFAGHVVFIGEASEVDLPEGSLLYMMCGVALDTHGGMTFHDADYIQLEPCVARRPR